MKNLLIIADGTVAKTFLERVSMIKGQKNRFYIVYYNDDVLPENKQENFVYYKFDPTSFSKLAGLLKQVDFYEVFLILVSRQDFTETYKNIRHIQTELPLILLDRWNLGIDDRFAKTVEANDILANRVVNFLPNVPVFAKEVGLGQGEIMEMEIPFTSPYAYKHIGSMEQSRWWIAALYRKQTLHMPNPNMMLLPNDIIVAVGNPAVLQSVYRSINQDFGQFPQPYGQNIYVIVDMKFLSDKEIESLTNDAFILHSKLNNKNLIFRVINPVLSKCYDKLKSYKNANISVLFEYEKNQIDEILKGDIKEFDIGLVVSSNEYFLEHKKLFFETKLPIFKIGEGSFYNIKKSIVISSDSLKVEKISSVVFDLSTQLGLDINLYEFEGIDEDENKKIKEHFNSLSKLFEKKVKIIQTDKNPIVELENSSNILQFVYFSENLSEINLFDKIFSMDLDEHSIKLKKAYQLYLPSL